MAELPHQNKIYMNIINPATEEIIATVQEDNKASLGKKIHALKNTQSSWADKLLTERIAVLNNFYDLLEAEKESLAAVLTSEVGKPLQQSL